MLRSIGSALSSAVIPGSGQLLIGHRWVGALFLVLFGSFLFLFWLLRFPGSFAPFALSLLGLPVLHLASAWHIVRLHRRVIGWRPRGTIIVACALVGFVAAGWTLRTVTIACGFRLYKMRSSSMEPAVLQDEVIVADLWHYRRHSVLRGDVVVYRYQNGVYAKRVVGIPGDEIRIEGIEVHLNGLVLNEPYAHYAFPGRPRLESTTGTWRLAENEHFVMGDDRDDSLDSRHPVHGNVTASDLAGKSLYVFSSPDFSRLGSRIR